MVSHFFWAILRLFLTAVFLMGALNVGQLNAQTKRTPLIGIVSFPAVEYNEWLKVQVDPSIKDADKVAWTIDTFFNLKYKSWMKLELLDFGFLFDRKNANGAEDYAYERGFYYSWIIAFRERTPPDSIESYKYEPKYSRLSVDNDKAEVRVYPKTLVVSSNPKGLTLDGSFTEHTFSLIYRGGLWLIRGVVCTDEQRRIYPHGTDFDEAIKKARKDNQEWEKKQAEEEAELMKDPELQRRLLRRKMLKKKREKGAVIQRP